MGFSLGEKRARGEDEKIGLGGGESSYNGKDSLLSGAVDTETSKSRNHRLGDGRKSITTRYKKNWKRFFRREPNSGRSRERGHLLLKN